MIEPEGGKTYNKHKLKVRAYIKAKQLMRKANKTFSNRKGTAAAIGLMKPPGDDEDDYEDLKAQQEERKERNRIWREKRDMERRRRLKTINEEKELSECLDLQPSLVEPSKSNAKWDKLKAFLVCTCCRRALCGPVWQCAIGHPVCRRCVDLDWLERDLSVSSVDNFSLISDNTVKAAIETMSEGELMQFLEFPETDTASHVSFSGPSWSAREIREIDWFLNTINIRRDAIRLYSDYHGGPSEAQPAEDDSEDEDSSGKEDNTDSEDEPEVDVWTKEPWRAIPKDEVELKNKASLNQVDADTTTTSSQGSGESIFDMTNIKPIDFDAGTIAVSKDVIKAYNDYHALVTEQAIRGVRIDDNVEIFQSDEDDISYISDDDISINDSASVQGGPDGRRRKKCRQCPDCEASIVGRTFFLEDLANKLMQTKF